MIDRSPPPRSQRIGVLSSVVALHLALLAGFLATRSPVPPPVLKTGVMSLVAINPDKPAQRPPPPPVVPSKLIDEIKKLTAEAIAMEPDSTALSAPSGQCATLDVVTKALIADPEAVAAVVRAPPETRSIAEAVVMWNAGWSSAANTPGAPLTPAREVVEQSLYSIEDGCLDEPIAGPRLVPIAVADTQETMFLVFGSGHWTWRQLLTQPVVAFSQTPPDQQRDKPWYEIDWFH